MVVRTLPAALLVAGFACVAVLFGVGLSTVTAYAPQLVLLVVVAAGCAGGVAYGAVTGFCSGLFLDLAPTSVNAVGTGALAFTIVGCLATVVGGRWSSDHVVARVVRPIGLGVMALAVVLVVFACFAAVLDEQRLDSTAVLATLTETWLPSALSTIALAPLAIPGMIGLLRKCG